MVIFDCDGVLIDSEPLSQEVVREEAATLGWKMTELELHGLTGLTWSALKPVFEAKLGRALPAEWPAMLQERLVGVLASGVNAMPGARKMLEDTARLGLPYRVASNSSHAEMAQKFAVTGLLPLVEGRMHSARDVARGKPAPDVFLAAAAAEGVEAQNCLVVEDSAPGIAAAHAAGMRVIGYSPSGAAAMHPDAPHSWIGDLRELRAILEEALTVLPA
jgi:HAD superfamily hydrolase (TIGR01509 family)